MAKGEILCDCDVIHQSTVDKVKDSMLTEESFFELADFFKIIGDSTRSKILWALDTSEMCVCDIAVLLGMTKSAVSHQLRVLREGNLVKYRREGKTVFYSLADDHVRTLVAMAKEHLEE